MGEKKNIQQLMACKQPCLDQLGCFILDSNSIILYHRGSKSFSLILSIAILITTSGSLTFECVVFYCILDCRTSLIYL